MTELKANRLEDVIQSMAKNEASANREIQSLTDEINQSNNQLKELQDRLIESSNNPQKIIERIEVIPAGYSSVQEAIKAKELSLEEKVNAVNEAGEKLKQIKRELLEAELEKKAMEENKAEVIKFLDDVKDITDKYSSKIISAIFTQESKETKAHLMSISKVLMMFSTNISEAVS